jgi:hypothetical protein
MGRILLLSLGAICIFFVVAGLMLNFMPGPLKESDYVVIGSVATLVALLVLFVVLISTTMKSSEIFFKRRKK